MNKRLEEKLAMLAFGDLSPEEITRLEQEVAGDREAMLVLEDYRGMRSGLKALGDIPEHQLSTDRLRDAILNQGLKPKPAKPQIGWLWMPAMAAVLTFGIVVVRGLNSPGVLPPVDLQKVAMGDTLPGESKPVTELMSTDMSSDPFAFASASGEIISVDTVERPARTVTARRTSPSRKEADVARVEALKDAIRREFDIHNRAPRALDRTPSESEPEFDVIHRAPRSEQDPIILIDSAKDKTTGAQRATEVDSASNVLVGG